jgi:hypothetical protein
VWNDGAPLGQHRAAWIAPAQGGIGWSCPASTGARGAVAPVQGKNNEITTDGDFIRSPRFSSKTLIVQKKNVRKTR